MFLKRSADWPLPLTADENLQCVWGAGFKGDSIENISVSFLAALTAAAFYKPESP